MAICLGLHWAGASMVGAAIPAGGSTPVAGLGVGSGTSTTFALERQAPAAAFQSSGASWVDAPNVTLRTSGDWSIFVATKSPGNANYVTGTVLSIGTSSNTLFTDTGHLDITWSAGYFNPWNQGAYAFSFAVTGKDDNGIPVSKRIPPNSETFFGQSGVTPLVGEGSFIDGRMHGLVVQCRSGVVEFWSVDDAGARIMDSSSQGVSSVHFTGITNKPLRIGAAHLVTQPSNPYTYWGQPVQCVVIDNEGCLTPVQMKRLFAGAHAQDVVSLNAANGDRYYPGTIASGTVSELVGGQVGTITGTVVAKASILPATLTDDVIVDMDGSGQVIPRDPPPASTTKVRFWGTRMGNTANIQMQVVQWGAPFPTPSAQVVVPWTTVATNVQNGQTWIGDLPGVPNAFANYDCDVSWQVGSTVTTKRLYRQWSLGLVASIAGQSILQKQRDDSGTARSFNPTVNGFLRGYYNCGQGTSGYQDNSQTQGWVGRYTPVSPTTNGGNFGELRMAEQMALLANCPVGIGSFAIGGTPLLPFLDTANGSTDQWLRWKLFIQRNRPQFGVWGNGQGDQGESQATRFSQLDQLLAQYDAAVQTAPGGPWNYMFYVFPCNGDWGGDMDGVRSQDIQWALSRAAMGKPVGIICSLLDESTSDGTHPSDNDAGGGLLASRMAQTFVSGAGLASNSGLGPQIDQQSSSWSVVSGVTRVNLVVIKNGGSSLVTEGGGAPSGFYISVNGGSYVAPASTSIVDASHILVTSNTAATSSVSVTYLANGPGNTYNVQNTTKAQAGTDNAVYDNRTDLTGLVPGFPMSPITQTNPFAVPQKPASAPGIPTGVTATAGALQITVNWAGVGGAAGYRIYRSTTTGGPYAIINGPSGPSVIAAGPYYDLTATPGVTYYYVVTAVNGAGESGNSSQVSATLSGGGGSPPATPSGVTAAPSNNLVTLNWTSVPGASTYAVYRATSSAGPFTALLGTTTAPTVTYNDATALNGTTYYYEVSATNGFGTSANSTPPVSATPSSGSSSTTIWLVNDGFTDGGRTNGTDAQDVAWYTIFAPTVTIVNDTGTGDINFGNAMEVTPNNGWNGMVANLPAAVTLADGESLSYSFDLRYTGTTNQNFADGFRFGIYNSNGTQTAGDNNTTVRTDDFGYYCSTNPGLVSSTGSTIWKEAAGDEIMEGTARTSLGTGASINMGTTPHSIQFILTRSGTSLIMSVSLDGGTPTTVTDASATNYTFDEIALTPSNTVPSPYLVDNVQVEHYKTFVFDGFTDGGRTNGTDLLDTAWYSIFAPTVTIVNDTGTGDINSGNAMEVTSSGGFQGMVANLPSSITLANGDSFVYTFDLRYTGTTNQNVADNFRFGVYNSNGTQTTSDNNTTVRTDDFGYYCSTNPGLVSSTGSTIWKEAAGDEIMEGTARTSLGTGASINMGTTPHSIQFILTRSGTSLLTSVSLDGGTPTTATDASATNYVFNEIGLTPGTSTPSPYLIDNVEVDYVPAH